MTTNNSRLAIAVMLVAMGAMVIALIAGFSASANGNSTPSPRRDLFVEEVEHNGVTYICFVFDEDGSSNASAGIDCLLPPTDTERQ